MLVWIMFAAATSAWGQSPREELNQLVAQLRSNPADQPLRERIIKLAQEIKPAPAVPEEARRALVRGNTALSEAKGPDDYQRAVVLYSEALDVAPWWGDVYFNLAKAREQLGNFDHSIRALGNYIKTNPSAEEARKAQDQIYILEERRDRAAKAAAAKQAADAFRAQRDADVASALDSLRGTFRVLRCSWTRDREYEGCNRAEFNGSSWYGMRDFNTGVDYTLQFKFLGNGTVEIGAPMGTSVGTWGQHGIVNKIVGVPNGLGNPRRPIDWTCHYDQGRTSAAVWADHSDTRGFTLTCDNVYEAGDQAQFKRYRYLQYRRL